MKIVPFDDDAESWPTVYRRLGKDFDVMVGAYERANGSDSFQDLKLGEYRFCVAVSMIRGWGVRWYPVECVLIEYAGCQLLS
jgi:hypothetical protein